MLGSLAKKIFGTANARRLKTYAPKVAAINALEGEVAALAASLRFFMTRDFLQTMECRDSGRRSASDLRQFRGRAGPP